MQEKKTRLGCYLTVKQIKDEGILPFKDSRTIRKFIRENLDFYFYINGTLVVSKKKLIGFLDNVACGTNLQTSYQQTKGRR